MYTIVGLNVAVLLLCVGYDIIVLLMLYYFSKLYLQQLFCCILHLSRILQGAKVQLKNCGKYADGRDVSGNFGILALTCLPHIPLALAIESSRNLEACT